MKTLFRKVECTRESPREVRRRLPSVHTCAYFEGPTLYGRERILLTAHHPRTEYETRLFVSGLSTAERGCVLVCQAARPKEEVETGDDGTFSSEHPCSVIAAFDDGVQFSASSAEGTESEPRQSQQEQE